MIRDFETWTSSIGENSDLNELRGTRVAIEAAHYLKTRILNPPEGPEPLVPALGGLPLGLTRHVNDDLARFASFQIEPLFVFSGLDLARPDNPFRGREEGALVNANAWSMYDNHEAQQSVMRFGESRYVTPEDLFCALQTLLSQRNVPFLVAPYSAWAQLAYMERHNTASAISGSSEILLFPCRKVITSWDLETGYFKFVNREKCIAELRKFTNNADITEDMFVDACLLSGSHFLQTLPNLDSPQRNKLPKPMGAIDMIINGGRTGISVVLNNQDDPRFQQIQYVDKYRKARLAVKHHPVLTAEGKIEPMAESQMPNDGHEFIGQRLPDEILHHLSRGLINSRILNWVATSEIVEAPPVDGGDSKEYQDLISSKLTPLRTTAINLLSSSLHNWYQHKDLTLKCWFLDASDKAYTATISMKGLADSKRLVETWNVKEPVFQKVLAEYKSRGYLGSAILALNSPDFVANSSTAKDKKKDNSNLLLTNTDEVLNNALWRFLAVREYVDQNHNLTAWGKVLIAVITTLKDNKELEEAAVMAVELLRLGILNDSTMFRNYNGAPMRGTERDQKFNLLVSRVSGLGRLHHKSIGFTGPLSKHLLGYNSIIEAVRSIVRDTVEVCATHLFMSGCVSRDIENLPEIASKLPFALPNNCALSIAVKSYLDELFTHEIPSSAETKALVSETAATRYFPQSESFESDLQTAFKLWDAVYEGVKGSGNLVPSQEKKHWTEANEWLSRLR
ncbi:PIN domain-like protein [Lophiostoma macrostomum CBS 122681]|uniref:PIN domain-like protein n=1 Tax=Lophiostoma macrostomum CBS 122681 TaxID=1314788 RepID=A0A6A6SQL9_9PLEO|nr:PIN domain-like protein [Lophiostoma macrostomum CBS 122681]